MGFVNLKLGGAKKKLVTIFPGFESWRLLSCSMMLFEKVKLHTSCLGNLSEEHGDAATNGLEKKWAYLKIGNAHQNCNLIWKKNVNQSAVPYFFLDKPILPIQFATLRHNLLLLIIRITWPVLKPEKVDPFRYKLM